MKILIFNWKDLKNPQAGGAELLTEEILRRLAKEGHEITMLCAGFPGCLPEETIDGVKIVRLGNRWTVYWQAFKYYQKYLRGNFDLVIDEINTLPFFTPIFVKEKKAVFIHQLAREIWFYEIFFPLNVIGYLLEPLYLRLYRKVPAITVSESTKKDLIDLGFRKENISIISEGIKTKPLKELPEAGDIKEKDFTIVSLGEIRPMKRVMGIVRAFKYCVKEIPTAKLWIAGGGQKPCLDKIKKYVFENKLSDKIIFFGRVSEEKKRDLLKRAHVLAATSLREGWCLVVTEANALGTPAAVYNVRGLRDSTKQMETGLVCEKNTPKCLKDNILKVFRDPKLYARLRQNAWQKSFEINFDKSAKDFENAIDKICNHW